MLVRQLLLLLAVIRSSQAACPNRCHGNGKCNSFNVCECNTGFKGADCSEKICPFGSAWSDMPYANDAAHSKAECSNRGICDRLTGLCSCMKGFVGSSCNRLDCPNKCNQAGQCYSMRERAMRTTDANGAAFSYTSNWDADMIRGCVCDSRYSDYDCSFKLCPKGDDPLTTGQANQVQLLRCVASTGSFVFNFGGYSSSQILTTASASDVRNALLSIPLITDAKVTFSPGLTTVCSITVGITQIEFTQQFGNNPAIVPAADTAMSSSGGRVQVSADGTTVWQDYRFTNYKSVIGTKENSVCSGRGLCSIDGTCACFSTNGDTYASSNGYGKSGSRGDCGFILSGSTVATCPGTVQCSGHGLCNKNTKACSCADGWEGGDCSMRSCPKGVSWYDYPTKNNVAHFSYAVCSAAGVCDFSTGNCQCNELFVGQACDRMVCGGGVTCSGHGRCMTMTELAQYADNNGDKRVVSYGANPNSAATWDGHRMQACLCDEGYTGYDCTLRTCPSGNDPGTSNDHVEVQLLQCTAATGSFTLTFRQSTTSAISATGTASDLRAALEALPNIIGRVDVWTLQDIFYWNVTIPEKTFRAAPQEKALPQGMPSWAAFNESLRAYARGDARGRNGTKLSGVFLDDRPVTDIFVPSALSPLCSTTGNQAIIVSFASTHGPLPALQPGTSRLSTGSSSITAAVRVLSDGASLTIGGATLYSVSGSTETAVCNNHGLCDQTTGECKCFPDWSSSDGAGGAGRLNDCGYIPTAATDAEGSEPKMDALFGRAVGSKTVKLLSLNSTVIDLHANAAGLQAGEKQYPGPVSPAEALNNMGPLDLREVRVGSNVKTLGQRAQVSN